MANRKPSLVLKILILLSKLKKPLARKVVSLKKLKLLEKYSYVKEYEFSPCSTPMSTKGKMSCKKLYSNLLLICRSFLGSRKKLRFEIVGLNSSLLCAQESAAAELSSGEDDDNNSVDERAERFIQSFYEEMRRQSISHLHAAPKLTLFSENM